MPYILNRETGTKEFVDKTQLQQGQIGGGQPMTGGVSGMDTNQLLQLYMSGAFGDPGSTGTGRTMTQLQTLGLFDQAKTPEKSITEKTQLNMGDAGLNYLQQAQQLYAKDPSLIVKQKIPGQYASRAFDNAIFGAVENLLRLKSGAAVPEQEVRRYMTKLAPNFGDNPEVVQQKWDNLTYELSNYAQVEDKPKTARQPTVQPPTRGTEGVDKLLSIPGKLFPQITELGKQAAAGTRFEPRAIEALLGPGMMLGRQDQLGKATKEIGLDAALGLLMGGVGKLIGKGASKIGTTLNPAKASAKLVQKGMQSATSKTIEGEKLAQEVLDWYSSKSTPSTIKASKGVQKEVLNVIQEYGGKKLPLDDAKQLFINLKSGYSKGGELSKTLGQKSIEPVLRKGIRKEFSRVGADDIMKGIETAAKGRATKETIKKYAMPTVIGSSIGIPLSVMLYKLLGSR